MIKSLRILPKVRDSWSYVYADYCRIEQDDKAIALVTERGKVPVPCATISLLMLGPGTSITHAAVKTLAENGCLIAWTGEGSVRFYAQGFGETRDSRRLLKQAALASHPTLRLVIVRRMYELRFPEKLDPGLSLQQIRGKEGVRMREAYARASRETGVEWSGRSYKQESWAEADPINRALSAAHSCLYGVCHAAIVAAGYSTAIGFIHTGKILSFVYDVADLYKAELTIPAAFQATVEGPHNLESRVRKGCRDLFHKERLLKRLIEDIDRLMDVDEAQLGPYQAYFDTNAAAPGGLWDANGAVEGGVNYADIQEEGEG
jgi:CRISP-associated protein Cas1